jgi:hypothetical protein
MAEIISPQELEKLKIFQKFENFQKKIICNRTNRELISHAFHVYKLNGYIDKNIGSTQLKILNELIENYENEKK